ncbi:MAG: hypothetical protein ACLFMM_00180 [Methanohalobium sp.]|uniref:hypothetical protein n=1 Tax=Methanohalobium sp. TaxID=2837493 RepID=UPI00397D21A7
MSIQYHYQLLKKRKLKLIYITLAFILTYFASWLPDFHLQGVEGSIISSVAAFGPLNGMILGPYIGPLVSFFGIITHVITNTSRLGDDVFLLVTPVFVMLSSLIAGLIITRREKPALYIYSTLIVLWYFFDIGRELFYLPWFHIIVLVTFIIFYKKYQHKLMHVSVYTFILLFMGSLIAVLSDHMAGNIAALLTLDLSAQLFESSVFMYPLERMILAFGAAFIMFIIVAVLQYSIIELNMGDNNIEDIKMDNLMNYAQHDVKRILEEEQDDEP